MSLSHAILGFLNYGPRTGYDLKRMFDSSVKHFWPAQQSHIYQALSRLAEDGLASVEVVPQDDRPNRKLYRITEEGEAEFRRWMTEPRPERPMRSPFLMQVFFSGSLEDDRILKLLESKADEIRALLSHFETGSVAQPTFAKDLPDREQFFWYLTLDFGIESARFSLRWIEEAIDRVRGKAYEQGIAGALAERRTH